MSRRPGKEPANPQAFKIRLKKRATGPTDETRQAVEQMYAATAGFQAAETTVENVQRLMFEMERNVHDSGPRHPHTRGVTSSVRRYRQPSVHIEEDIGYSINEGDDEDFEEELVPSTHFPEMDFRHQSGRYATREATSCTTSTSGGRRKKGRAAVDNSWMVSGPMPGGPHDGSVIPSFGGHVARNIWEGKTRRVLKCQNRHRASTSLRDWIDGLSEEGADLINGTMLSHLPYCVFPHIDHDLVSAFVERWQPDTNTFHMPFGEMTIMLHDVWHILRIPIHGDQVSGQSAVDELKDGVANLLGVNADTLVNGSEFWDHGCLTVDSAIKRISLYGPELVQVQGILFFIFGCILFPDKSGSRMKPQDILETENIEMISHYAWGATTLAYLYRQLGICSRNDCLQMTGYLTLLQSWIYEYFPVFRPVSQRLPIQATWARCKQWSVPKITTSQERLHQLRVQIDHLTANEIDWLPYGSHPSRHLPRTLYFGTIRYRDIVEPYMPDRVIRQLGYMQGVPRLTIIWPEKAVRPSASMKYEVVHGDAANMTSWMNFPDLSCITLDPRVQCVGQSRVTPDYTTWYLKYSHPKLLPPETIESHTPAATQDPYSLELWHARWVNATRGVLDGEDESPDVEEEMLGESRAQIKKLMLDFQSLMSKHSFY